MIRAVARILKQSVKRQKIHSHRCAMILLFLCTDSAACLEKWGARRLRICVLHFSNRQKQIENEVCSYFVRPDAYVVTEPYGVRVLRARVCVWRCTCVHICAHVPAYNSRCIQLRRSVSSPDFAACKNSVVVAVSTWNIFIPSPPLFPTLSLSLVFILVGVVFVVGVRLVGRLE